MPEHLVPTEDHVFMLEIVGESMIEAGILNGDYVIVRQQQTANNGEIVVAMTEDDEATVKRFFKEKDFSDFNRKIQTWSQLSFAMYLSLEKSLDYTGKSFTENQKPIERGCPKHKSQAGIL